MKKDILKIAGVKSEKEFYKKYPTEAAFMKAHKKEFKKAAMGASMVNKQLTQLTDFSNPPQAQNGNAIGGIPPQYRTVNTDYTNLGQQVNPYGGQTLNTATYDKNTGMIGSSTGQVSMADTQNLGFKNSGNKTLNRTVQDLSANDIQSGVQMTSSIGQGYQKISNAIKEKKKAKQLRALAPVIEEASGIRPEISKRRYVRPEDMAFQTPQMGQAYGVGTNFLAEDGAMIGGNPTEIQNMYNPGDIYSDMGYEPLSDSSKVKQYKKGGFVPKAQGGDALAWIKEGIDTGTDLAAGIINIGTEKLNKQSGKFLGQAGFQSGMQGVQDGQYSGFMEDGGWVSHDWQPQVITQFGGYDMKDLFKADPTMDTLRAGGYIKAQKGKALLPSNPSGYADSVINANKNIQFYKDVLDKKAPEISEFPGMFSETEIRGMDDSSEKNPYVGARTSAKPYFSYVNGKYIPIEGMREAYEDKTMPSINFPSQYAAGVFEEELRKKTKKQRSGGHLGQVPYTPASARAMSTERPDFAMGGQLKTTWGGDAEPISYNPYLPGSGETVMFKGNSHEESDGNGHTGIGVKYGEGAQDSYTDYAEYGTKQADAHVEVEDNEPAAQLTDPETGDTNLVVYGNMKIPSYGVSELGDKKAKGKKFKHIANEYSKQEATQNKIIEKGLTLIDSVDSDNPFDLLKLQAGHAMVTGANMKQKELAYKKQMLAGIQNAILDTAKEHGLESDALAKGKIKKAKASDMARFGAKMETAQLGVSQPSRWMPSNEDMINGLSFDPSTGSTVLDYYKNLPEVTVKGKKVGSNAKAPIQKAAIQKAITQQATSTNQDPYISSLNDRWNQYLPEKSPNIPVPWRSEQDAKNFAAILASKKADSDKKDKTKKDKFDWQTPYNMLSQTFKPLIKNRLGPEQLAADMYSLATNQLEPVPSQQYSPLLETPYSVSFQDQMNANQADFNAIARRIGADPSALATLAGQKYAANSGVLGQQFRANQEMQMGTANRNRATLNDSFLKNLVINDTQEGRKAQAKSNTKQQAYAALSSIADKIARNKSETLQANVQANMYPQYSFGPKGRIYNTGMANFNIPEIAAGLSADQLQTLLDQKKAEEKKSGTKARNGSIVKALKNL